MFNRRNDTDADEFWKKREEEIGSPVLAKTLGRLLTQDKNPPIWAIFYTSEHSVFYQTFRTENWMSLLFSRGRNSGSGRDEIIEIKRDSLQTFGIRKHKKGLLSFLDRSNQIEISWKEHKGGDLRTIVFEMDGDAGDFINSLPNWNQG